MLRYADSNSNMHKSRVCVHTCLFCYFGNGIVESFVCLIWKPIFRMLEFGIHPKMNVTKCSINLYDDLGWIPYSTYYICSICMVRQCAAMYIVCKMLISNKCSQKNCTALRYTLLMTSKWTIKIHIKSSYWMVWTGRLHFKCLIVNEWLWKKHECWHKECDHLVKRSEWKHFYLLIVIMQII